MAGPTLPPQRCMLSFDTDFNSDSAAVVAATTVATSHLWEAKKQVHLTYQNSGCCHHCHYRSHFANGRQKSNVHSDSGAVVAATTVATTGEKHVLSTYQKTLFY